MFRPCANQTARRGYAIPWCSTTQKAMRSTRNRIRPEPTNPGPTAANLLLRPRSRRLRKHDLAPAHHEHESRETQKQIPTIASCAKRTTYTIPIGRPLKKFSSHPETSRRGRSQQALRLSRESPWKALSQNAALLSHQPTSARHPPQSAQSCRSTLPSESYGASSRIIRIYRFESNFLPVDAPDM